MNTKSWMGMNWIRKEKRLAIYIRDGFSCQCCGQDLRNSAPGQISLDHLRPRSQNGSNHESNLMTICTPCNSQRQDKPWKEYYPPGSHARVTMQSIEPLNLSLAKAILSCTPWHDCIKKVVTDPQK